MCMLLLKNCHHPVIKWWIVMGSLFFGGCKHWSDMLFTLLVNPFASDDIWLLCLQLWALFSSSCQRLPRVHHPENWPRLLEWQILALSCAGPRHYCAPSCCFSVGCDLSLGTLPPSLHSCPISWIRHRCFNDSLFCTQTLSVSRFFFFFLNTNLTLIFRTTQHFDWHLQLIHIKMIGPCGAS